MALVLVFLVMFSVVIGLLLTQVQSSFVLNRATQSESRLLYAADSGLEWAISQLGQSPLCPSSWSSSQASGVKVTSSGVTGVTLSCQQATGPGSNLFGGYALVTGVGYPSTAASQHAEGTTTCQSISSDPPNNGTNKTTWGSGTGSCLTYPSGTGGPATPLWANDLAGASPVPNVQLNAVTSPDQQDIYMVGQQGGGGVESIWHYDGDDFVQVTTTSNTSHVTKQNLFGVWASDPSHVWAVGQNGTVLACSGTCSDTTSTWASQTTPGNAQLNDVTGVTANGTTTLFAVGNAAGGVGTVLTSDGSGTWTLLGGGVPVNKNLFAVYAKDASDVWVVGQAGCIYYWNGSVWSDQTIAGAKDLHAVAGTDSTHLWVAGDNATYTCTLNCTSSNGNLLALPVWSPVPLGAVPQAQSVVAADNTDVWIVGNNAISYCTTLCNTAAALWTSQTLPTGTKQLFGSSSSTPTNGQSWTGNVFAVGAGPAVLTYAPLSTTPTILGRIIGGPVYNAQGWNFASGVEVANNYTQQLTSCSGWTTPSNLVIDSGYSASCVTSLDPSSQLYKLDKPLPASVPATAPNPITVPVTGATNCPSYVVMQPGTYTSKVNFTRNTTYFFESGVYYFTAGFGAFDNGNNWVTIGSLTSALAANTQYTSLQVSALTQNVPAGDTLALNNGSQTVTVASPGAAVGATTIPVTTFTAGANYATNTAVGADNLFVIGGRPTKGDSSTISSASPCWSAIQASSYYDVGSPETGVEWILGGTAWMDVHTINLELFTHEGGNESVEGAQGISIHEVPPTCAAGQQPSYGPSCVASGSGWTPSAPGGPDQIVQVDANDHYPTVFIHGGLYTPTNNIEEFTNSAAVTLGPIDCNSFEMSFETAQSPALRIEAGTGSPSVAIIATATGNGAPFSEEAVWGVDPANPTEPPKVMNWWVLNANRT